MSQPPTFKPVKQQMETRRKQMHQEFTLRIERVKKQRQSNNSRKRTSVSQAERDEIADYLARNPPRVW